jgi:hypothetical protein
MNSLHFKWIIVKILLDWDQLLAILNFQLPVSWKVVGTFYSFCLFFCFLFFYVSYGFPLVTLSLFFFFFLAFCFHNLLCPLWLVWYRNRCLDLLSFICLSELLKIWNSRVQINFRLSGHWPRQVNFIQQLSVWITRNLKLTCPNKF